MAQRIPVMPSFCDIYTGTGLINYGAKRLSSVPCAIYPAFASGARTYPNNAVPWYTHVLILPAGTDIRDNFTGWGGPGTSFGDFVASPAGGTPRFKVLIALRKYRDLASEHVRVYVQRGGVTWPSSGF